MARGEFVPTINLDMNDRRRFHGPRRRPPDRKARCSAGQGERPLPDQFSNGSQPTVGNAADDGAHTAGWFVGPFLDPTEAGLRATSTFEAKWSAHERGAQRDCWAVDKGRATIVILIHGRLRLHLADADHVLAKPGDYILWGQGIDHSWAVEKDSLVITFRLPST